MARRHSPLFALALVILTGEHMADAASRVFPRRDGEAASTRFVPPVWISLTFLVMAIACLALTTP